MPRGQDLGLNAGIWVSEARIWVSKARFWVLKARILVSKVRIWIWISEQKLGFISEISWDFDF